jgi:hypothetical protein
MALISAADGNLGVSTAFAAPPRVEMNITTGPLTVPGNIPGDTTGDAVHYAYSIVEGTSIVDSIPVRMCMTSQTGTWSSFDIHVGVLGIGNLPGVTLPGDTTFTYDGTLQCKSVSMQLNTGILSAGNYAVNVNMTAPQAAQNPGNLQVSLNEGTQTVHIKVAVFKPTDTVSCFLTDSEGNFLNDCAGVPANQSASSNGRFAIVVNKKNLEVATNPGQFYYNIIWRNTTAAGQYVSASFARTGVGPKGAQALHAWVTNGYLSTITPTEFDTTNEIGIPGGSDDLIGPVYVPAGSSLVVTYHLEWLGIGAAAPANCASTCTTANQLIRVIGNVSGAYIPTATCKSEAYGYKK